MPQKPLDKIFILSTPQTPRIKELIAGKKKKDSQHKQPYEAIRNQLAFLHQTEKRHFQLPSYYCIYKTLVNTAVTTGRMPQFILPHLTLSYPR